MSPEGFRIIWYGNKLEITCFAHNNYFTIIISHNMSHSSYIISSKNSYFTIVVMWNGYFQALNVLIKIWEMS